MNIAIRADASITIGSGHIMRCLTLANAIQQQQPNAKFLFICSQHTGHLAELINRKGHQVKLLSCTNEPIANDYNSWLSDTLENDAIKTIDAIGDQLIDLIITDHYGIEQHWQRLLRPHTQSILAIDDLANRPLDCDILLDQTFLRPPKDYKTLVPASCLILTGADYMLLREEFNAHQRQAKQQRLQRPINHLLITMGGTDPNNITAKIIQQLIASPNTWDRKITIVLGEKSPHINSIRQQLKPTALDYELCIGAKDIPTLLLKADICIGAAGGMTWERCCLGLPTLMIGIAKNQDNIMENLASHNICETLKLENLDNNFSEKMQTLIQNAAQLSKSSFAVTDGNGAKRLTQHIVQQLDKKGENISLRIAKNTDIKLVYQWQNLPETRRYARNPEIPSFAQHEQWMINKLQSDTAYFYIIQQQKNDVGVLRLDLVQQNTYEISIYIAPKYFGLGIASIAIGRAKKLHQNIDILATVLDENSVSKRLFIKQGFVFQGNNEYLFTA